MKFFAAMWAVGAAVAVVVAAAFGGLPMAALCALCFAAGGWSSMLILEDENEA